MYRILTVTFVGMLALSGCANKARSSEHEGRNFTTGLAFTSADVRVIEERNDPRNLSRKIVCAEPGPDVAEALSTVEKLQAKGGNGTVNASLAANFESQQALQELAGRTTALLGLRDGLFRACEAYANGAIGDDAYALILSRYSQLMATLFLAQDIEEVGKPTPSFGTLQNQIARRATSAGGGTQTGIAANATGGGKAAGGKATGGKATGGKATGKGEPAANKGGNAAADEDMSPRFGGLITSALFLGKRVPIVDAKAVAASGAPSAEKPGGAAAAGNGAGSSGGTSSSASIAAKAIGTMEKEYLNIDNERDEILGVIVVACINQDDPSLPKYGQQNTFLDAFCNKSGLLALSQVFKK